MPFPPHFRHPYYKLYKQCGANTETGAEESVQGHSHSDCFCAGFSFLLGLITVLSDGFGIITVLSDGFGRMAYSNYHIVTPTWGGHSHFDKNTEIMQDLLIEPIKEQRTDTLSHRHTFKP